MILQWEDHHLPPQQKFVRRFLNKLQCLWYCTLQKFRNDLLMTFILLLKIRTCKTFKFTMEEESNAKLAFFDTLFKWNKRKILVLIHRKPMYTTQYLHYSSYHQTSCLIYASFLLNMACSIVINKDDLNQEHIRMKQVLKKNGYQESIISNICKRIANNSSLFQSQQQTQVTDIQEDEIKMSINLP